MNNYYGSTGGPEQEAAAALAGTVGLCSAFFALLIAIFMIFLLWRILRRAGYSGWWALLSLIPLGMFVPLIMLAFGDWPTLRQRPAVIEQPGGGYGPGTMGGGTTSGPGGAGTYPPPPPAYPEDQPPSAGPPVG